MATKSKSVAVATAKATGNHVVKFTYVETRKGCGHMDVEALAEAEALAAAKVMLEELGDDEVMERSYKFGSHRTKVKVTFDEPT
jgi:hypothetical protein